MSLLSTLMGIQPFIFTIVGVADSSKEAIEAAQFEYVEASYSEVPLVVTSFGCLVGLASTTRVSPLLPITRNSLRR